MLALAQRSRPTSAADSRPLARTGCTRRSRRCPARTTAGRPGSLGRLQHDRARAIAEQHAGRAVLPVEDPREHVGADHQHALVHAAQDELAAGRQSVHEAAAAPRSDRTRRLACAPSAVLHQRGRRGHVRVVRRARRDDDQVEVVRLDARPSPSARARRATASVQVVSSGAAIRRSTMPVRARIHSSEVSTSSLELGVGHDPLGQVLARARRSARSARSRVRLRLGRRPLAWLDQHQRVARVDQLARCRPGTATMRPDSSAVTSLKIFIVSIRPITASASTQSPSLDVGARRRASAIGRTRR